MTIKNKISKFYKLMQEHDNTGADDTEPRALFKHLLERSFRGEDFDKDTFDIEHWSLYEGNDEVAQELTAKYEQLHYDIQDALHSEIVEASNYYGIDY
jgi:hypothetical protein